MGKLRWCWPRHHIRYFLENSPLVFFGLPCSQVYRWISSLGPRPHLASLLLLRPPFAVPPLPTESYVSAVLLFGLCSSHTLSPPPFSDRITPASQSCPSRSPTISQLPFPGAGSAFPAHCLDSSPGDIKLSEMGPPIPPI